MNKKAMKAVINRCLAEMQSTSTNSVIHGCDKLGRRILQQAIVMDSALIRNMDFVRRISYAEFMVDIPKEYFEDVADILAAMSNKDVYFRIESRNA